MELDSLYAANSIIDMYIVEKLNELSNSEVENLRANTIEFERFILENLYSDILSNNLKKSIVDTLDFCERKVFLMKVETHLFKMQAKKFHERREYLKE